MNNEHEIDGGLSDGRGGLSRRRVTGVAAAAVAGALMAGAGVSPPVHAADISATTVTQSAARAAVNKVSDSHATRMVQSNARLFWSVNRIRTIGTSTSVVLVALKESAPGHDQVLYQVFHHGELRFGAVAYARIGTTWFGYVVVNNVERRTSQIHRFPLAGGPGRVLATAPAYIGPRDLISHGSALYWADAGGLRKLPVGGGDVDTLVSGTGTLRVAMGTTHVYYSTGSHIRAVDPTDGSIVAIATATSDVTALHVRPATNSRVTWGEHNGSVRGVTVGAPGQRTYQGPTDGLVVRGVANAGTWVSWAHCTTSGTPLCTVKKWRFGFTTVATRQAGAVDLQADPTSMFWGTTDGIMRHLH